MKTWQQQQLQQRDLRGRLLGEKAVWLHAANIVVLISFCFDDSDFDIG